MAWPPDPIAADKANATDKVDDHAPHHNALADAINDLVAFGPAPASSTPVVANDGVAITDANFARPTAPLVIWPMADGVEPVNAVFPDIINTAAPVATVPDAPTIGTATAGNEQATVTFTPPADDGGATITGYTVTSSPGAITGTGASSPITVTGLTNDTEYTFTVTATNSVGTSDPSAASNAVTPVAAGATVYYTDFGEDTVGSSSPDFTFRWITHGITQTVETDATAPSGKAMVVNISSSTARRVIGFNPVNADTSRDNVDMVFMWKGSGDCRGVARASGSASSENGYVVGSRGPTMTSNANEAQVVKYVGGSFTVVDTGTGAPTRSTTAWYYTRSRVNGTTFQTRTWAVGDSEPATWEIEPTDSSISGVGWVGVFHNHSSGADMRLGMFSVATGGGTAPLTAP